MFLTNTTLNSLKVSMSLLYACFNLLHVHISLGFGENTNKEKEWCKETSSKDSWKKVFYIFVFQHFHLNSEKVLITSW